MNNHTLSPLDDRYQKKTSELKKYFSEYNFFRYRLFIEISYFICLIDFIPKLNQLSESKNLIYNIYKEYNENDYNLIKFYENKTNHDVKALEYFIQDKFKNINLEKYISFIHFGLTSQDINTSANMLSLKDSIENIIIISLIHIVDSLKNLSHEMKDVVMLSFTHGQPAVPTTMGKEFKVFYYRLEEQINLLKNNIYTTKFGGAVGNFNSHYFCFPDLNWIEFSNNYINSLGLKREKFTTQISNYDHLCNIFNLLKTINNIINDLNIDIWLYISKKYLIQKVNKSEVGSSTMPHKVNPINFENSEGNICIANSLIEGITRKLSISRLQRDLTDSTILRNIGVILGYCLVSYKSTLEGLSKISPNLHVINKDLEDNKIVLSEAIQSALRKHGNSNAYEI